MPYICISYAMEYKSITLICMASSIILICFVLGLLEGSLLKR